MSFVMLPTHLKISFSLQIADHVHVSYCTYTGDHFQNVIPN